MKMAEGEGFEPPESLHPQRFSRPPQSTTLPPLRRAGRAEAASLYHADLLRQARWRPVHDLEKWEPVFRPIAHQTQ
jgi:hypothetical protein